MNNDFIILLANGYPQSGKDTFVDALHALASANGIHCHKYSTVQTIKEMARILGWDGVKTPLVRAQLSELKDYCTKKFDLSFREIAQLIQDMDEIKTKPKLLSVMIREPDEIERLIYHYKGWKDLRVLTIEVKRNVSTKTIASNHADRDIGDIEYDYTIYNNGTIYDLTRTIVNFLEEL